MPTYEYECRACAYSFERVQNMSDDPVKECPKCGKAVRRLIFGGSGVIFKGSGFYVNDSRGKNAAASTEHTQSDAKSEAKGEAKVEGSGSKGQTESPGSSESSAKPGCQTAPSSPTKPTTQAMPTSSAVKERA